MYFCVHSLRLFPRFLLSAANSDLFTAAKVRAWGAVCAQMNGLDVFLLTFVYLVIGYGV